MSLNECISMMYHSSSFSLWISRMGISSFDISPLRDSMMERLYGKYIWISIVAKNNSSITHFTNFLSHSVALVKEKDLHVRSLPQKAIKKGCCFNRCVSSSRAIWWDTPSKLKSDCGWADVRCVVTQNDEMMEKRGIIFRWQSRRSTWSN